MNKLTAMKILPLENWFQTAMMSPAGQENFLQTQTTRNYHHNRRQKHTNPPKCKCNIDTLNMFFRIKEFEYFKRTPGVSRNRREMSGHDLVAKKTLFWNDEFHNEVNISSSSTIEEVVIGVPNREYDHWTLHWYNETILKAKPLYYFQTQVKKKVKAELTTIWGPWKIW